MARTTFSGPVKSDNGFEGTITGNVTGNVTGNLNGTVGATTPAAGTFTSLTASGVTVLSNASISMANLPTSDPAVAGRLWVDGTTLKVSAG